MAEGARSTTAQAIEYACVDPMMTVHLNFALLLPIRVQFKGGEQSQWNGSSFAAKEEQTWATRTEALFSHFKMKDAALTLQI